MSAAVSDQRAIKHYSLDRMTIFSKPKEKGQRAATACFKVRDGYPRLEIRKNVVENAEYKDNVILIKFTFDKLFNTLRHFKSILEKGIPDKIEVESRDKAWDPEANAPGKDIKTTGKLKLELMEKGLVVITVKDPFNNEFAFPMMASSDYYKVFGKLDVEVSVSKENSFTTGVSYIETIEQQMQLILHRHTVDNVYIKQ